jgi:hypothetical protein
MIGIGGASEFLRVARVAIRWRAREDVVDMALNARDAHMSADQPKRRPVVIELGPIPRSCAMSNGAGQVVRARQREWRLVVIEPSASPTSGVVAYGTVGREIRPA